MPIFDRLMEMALWLAPFALVLDALMLMVGIIALRWLAARKERDALILRRIQGR